MEGMISKEDTHSKLCSSGGCTNNAKKGGVCMRHGANKEVKNEFTFDQQ
jgi:hypothetical protein